MHPDNGVKQRRIALNKPLSFQPTHTLKARRWGKSHTFRKLDVRNTPILCNSLRMLRSIRSDLCGALLAIYHYYCLSVFLPYSCLTLKHHCSESLPVTIDRNHEDSRRAMPGSTVRRPLPCGSYRHHEWRLSTPYVDFTSTVNMVFTCMVMRI